MTFLEEEFTLLWRIKLKLHAQELKIFVSPSNKEKKKIKTQNNKILTFIGIPISKNLLQNLHSLIQSTKRIAIVGRRNAGKSTFLNALLRRNILPHHHAATTAVPTEVNKSITKILLEKIIFNNSKPKIKKKKTNKHTNKSYNQTNKQIKTKAIHKNCLLIT